MANMIGAYGEWAAGLVADPPRLSFRRREWTDVNRWRVEARKRFLDALMQPPPSRPPQPSVQHMMEYDGVAIEHMTWQLPYGPPTEALFLKPAGVPGKLPAVLGLHDHGGNKYFGVRKITRMTDDQHPAMKRHQERYYGGVAWANALAKRGYAVLVHDTFLFGSRRVRAADLPAVVKGDLLEQDPESEPEIDRYNRFAGTHEHLVAKSLFCAGATWPGVFVWEDQRALDVLCARPDVDASRVACCGLSGGGLRTVMLTGADDRIRVSCCAGMMTTWRDYLLNKAHTHTWMVYVPGLPRDLDYPEILGIAAPRPVMVVNNRQDSLFTMPEMERADRILTEVYKKAGVPERYACKFYPGPHKFDLEMQKDAFDWFDRWMK
ncbi:MAG: hypothetical protein HYZ37_10265 [Candidatus Solibacter usitatus]|nr:hypothetical protein [Candidatus Solibacter usitatus]